MRIGDGSILDGPQIIFKGMDACGISIFCF